MPTPKAVTIQDAALHLKEGKCVAMPTETVYGLAARVDSAEGIAAIFKLKERPHFDPLIVHVSDMNQVSELVNEWPPVAQSLATAFWPGPLTLVVKKKVSLNPMISSGLDTVGLRMPNHPIALALIKAAGHPLAAPSANRFGRTSPTTAAHVSLEFKAALDSGEILLLDGGACDVGVESTVCLVKHDQIIILRPGGVTREALLEHFNKSSEFRDVTVTESPGNAASPGHTEHHYETAKPLIVSWSEPFGARSEYSFENKTIAASRTHELKLDADPRLAARMLYACLREGDEHVGSDALFIQRHFSTRDERGLWEAIDDRLSRAARLQIGKIPERGA